MMRSIPPRLRAPLKMLVFGAVFAAVAVTAYGWGSLLHLGPVILAGPAVYYVWGGRNSDSAAMIRQQPDERQAYRGLKIQAVVGEGHEHRRQHRLPGRLGSQGHALAVRDLPRPFRRRACRRVGDHP